MTKRYTLEEIEKLVRKGKIKAFNDITGRAVRRIKLTEEEK